MKFFWTFLLIIPVCFAQGCSTIYADYGSEPSGAAIYAGKSMEKLKYLGTTPHTQEFTAPSPYWKSFYFKFVKPGYKEKIINSSREPTGSSRTLFVYLEKEKNAEAKKIAAEKAAAERAAKVAAKKAEYERIAAEKVEIEEAKEMAQLEKITVDKPANKYTYTTEPAARNREREKAATCKGLEDLTGIFIEGRQKGLALSDMHKTILDFVGNSSTREMLFTKKIVTIVLTTIYEIPLSEIRLQGDQIKNLVYLNCIKGFE